MRKKVEVLLHPNSKTKIVTEGWNVKGHAGVQVNVKNLSFCFEFGKETVLTVYERDPETGDFEDDDPLFERNFIHFNKNSLKKKPSPFLIGTIWRDPETGSEREVIAFDGKANKVLWANLCGPSCDRHWQSLESWNKWMAGAIRIRA